MRMTAGCACDLLLSRAYCVKSRERLDARSSSVKGVKTPIRVDISPVFGSLLRPTSVQPRTECSVVVRATG
jgi:hypothetical protein